jgi:hypothetical protein
MPSIMSKEAGFIGFLDWLLAKDALMRDRRRSA